jgi:DNA polymerase-3 subunit beta
MKLNIQSDVIKALLIIAAKGDIRYYLNGVCVDARENGDVVLVATDGHRLLAVPMEAADVEELAPGEYIIPRDVLAAVKPNKAGRTTFPLSLEITTPAPAPDPERPGVTVQARPVFTLIGATTATGLTIGGRYPDWRRVMPASATGEPGAYQPAYIGDFGAVAALLHGSTKVHPKIHQSGPEGSALVSCLGRNALGVVMPLRCDAEELAHPGLPAWALK